LKKKTRIRFGGDLSLSLAENQTNGRGQRGANWEVEGGKNLTFSILIKDVLLSFEEVFNLNVIVAVSLFQTFSNLKIPNLTIKWANDILADKKKICQSCLFYLSIVIKSQEPNSQGIIFFVTC